MKMMVVVEPPVATLTMKIQSPHPWLPSYVFEGETDQLMMRLLTRRYMDGTLLENMYKIAGLLPIQVT